VELKDIYKLKHCALGPGGDGGHYLQGETGQGGSLQREVSLKKRLIL
jgi:hypothetical protein